jgi:protein TonB
MLISNFNLCKDEWLELVFAKRNKEYGAFYIRQHYAQNIVKAMSITFASVIGATVVVGILIAPKPVTERIVTLNTEEVFKVQPPPKTDLPKPKPTEASAAPPKQTFNIDTKRLLPPVVTIDPVTDDIPKIEENVAVAQVTINGNEKGNNAEDGTGVGNGKSGNSVGTGESDIDNTTYIFAEKMPEPANGMNGWMKFLQGNIRYPGLAAENGITGKVLVSFIIEKDGQLSNIKVERGQGYGLDEEAIRVLKLAKAWKPGMQNGRPIRVKLTLPITFSLGE